jgi:hypothetical protein
MSFDPRPNLPPSPYAAGPLSDPYAPRRGSGGSTLLWLVLGGGGLTLILLCCGGGMAVLLFTRSVMVAEVKDQLRDNPKLREHIGELEEVELDFAGSIAEDDDNTFRYNVRGSKASGELTVIEANEDETIVEAKLRLKDGTQVQILP